MENAGLTHFPAVNHTQHHHYDKTEETSDTEVCQLQLRILLLLCQPRQLSC